MTAVKSLLLIVDHGKRSQRQPIIKLQVNKVRKQSRALIDSTLRFLSDGVVHNGLCAVGKNHRQCPPPLLYHHNTCNTIMRHSVILPDAVLGNDEQEQEDTGRKVHWGWNKSRMLDKESNRGGNKIQYISSATDTGLQTPPGHPDSCTTQHRPRYTPSRSVSVSSQPTLENWRLGGWAWWEILPITHLAHEGA
ncbi:hypothetical protein E2C01_016204 [Portunus trituberculatus]|uniref:Uncharacterized protein n=1 Tax=Portunus trituberculatus TaxID=210409 RepID=A0A5B7DQF9_PORTR|nr:hypothetical protein [Portunus trituberculatus]